MTLQSSSFPNLRRRFLDYSSYGDYIATVQSTLPRATAISDSDTGIIEELEPPRKKNRFNSDFGLTEAPLKVVFTTPNKPSELQTYYLHKRKLNNTSEYFFDYQIDKAHATGQEFADVKEIDITDSFLPESELFGLEVEFESFVEYLYRGDYSFQSEDKDKCVRSGKKCVYHAKMIVLANILKAEELLELAIHKLEMEWLSQRPDVENAIQVIRNVYDETEQPPYNHQAVFIEDTAVSGYSNCRSRKMVAKLAAHSLEWLRNYQVFRDLVEEGGPFVTDLLMEKLSVPISPLVRLVDL